MDNNEKAVPAGGVPRFADEPYANMPVSEIISDNPEDCAREIFKEGLVGAAGEIVHLSHHGDSERIRLEASKYVVERNLGKITGGDASDTWDNLLRDITSKPETD